MGASHSRDSDFCAKENLDLYGCCLQQRGAESVRGAGRFDESEHRKVAASVAKIRSSFKDRWNTHGRDVLATEKNVHSTVISVAVMDERSCVEVLRRLSPSERKEWVLTLQACLQRVKDKAESPQAFISRFGLRHQEVKRFMFLLENPREVAKLNSMQDEVGSFTAPQQTRTPKFQPTPSDPLRRHPSSTPTAQDVGRWHGSLPASPPAKVQSAAPAPAPEPEPILRRRGSTEGKKVHVKVTPAKEREVDIEAIAASYYGTRPASTTPTGALLEKMTGTTPKGLERRPSQSGLGRRSSIRSTGSNASGEGEGRRRGSIDKSPTATPERRSRSNSVSSLSKGENIDLLGFKRGPSADAVDMKGFRPSDQCHMEMDASNYDEKTKILVGKEIPWTRAYDPAAKVI